MYDECEGRDQPVVKSQVNPFARQIKKLPSTEDDYALSPSESDDNELDEEEDLFADHEECFEPDAVQPDDKASKPTKSRSDPKAGTTAIHGGTGGGSFSSTDSLDRGHIGQLERLIRTHAVWLLGSSGRSVVTRLLIGKPIGSFIVRASSKQHTMALSVRLPVGRGPHVEHYLIEELAERKLHLEGSVHYFSVLPQLICHYCQCADELPVQLQLPEPLQTNKRTELARLARSGAKFWESLPIESEQVDRIEPADRADSGQPPSLSPVPPPPPPHHNRAYLNERALMLTSTASPPPVPPKSDALSKKSVSLDESVDNEESISEPILTCPPRPPRATPTGKTSLTVDPPPVPSRHTKPASKADLVLQTTSTDTDPVEGCESEIKSGRDAEEWSFGGFEILAEEEALIKRLQEENDALDLELLTASTQRWFNETVDLDLVGDRAESSASADRRQFANHASEINPPEDRHQSSALSNGHSPTHSHMSNSASGPTSGVSSCLTSGFASGFTSGFGQIDIGDVTVQPLVSAQFVHQKISFSEVNGQHKTSIVVNESNVTSITIGEPIDSNSKSKFSNDFGRSLSESPPQVTDRTATADLEKRSSTLDNRTEDSKPCDYEDIWTNRNRIKTEETSTNQFSKMDGTDAFEKPITLDTKDMAVEEDNEVDRICSSFVQHSISEPKPNKLLLKTASVRCDTSSERDQCSPFYCDPIDAILSPATTNPSTSIVAASRGRAHFGSDPNVTNSNPVGRGESNSLESLLINFRNCIYESWPNRLSNANQTSNQTKDAVSQSKSISSGHETNGQTLRIKLNQLRQLHARAGSAQSGLYGCKPISLGTGTSSGQPDMCWQVDSSWRWQSSDEEDEDSPADADVAQTVEPTQSNGQDKIRIKKRLDSIDRKMRSDQLQPYRRYSYRYVMESGVESETEYESSAQVHAQVQMLQRNENGGQVAKSATCTVLAGSHTTHTETNKNSVEPLQRMASNSDLPTETTNVQQVQVKSKSNDLEDWNDLLRMPDEMQQRESLAVNESQQKFPMSSAHLVNRNENEDANESRMASMNGHEATNSNSKTNPSASHEENEDDDDDDEDEIMFEEIGLEDAETNDELDDIYEDNRVRPQRHDDAVGRRSINRVRPYLVEDPYMSRNQLLLRSDCGRQLGDYIQKLAEQSDNTFARSIDRFVRCTLDSKETSGRVVMRNVRQFMSGLKNYLGKHGEKDFGRIAAAERSRLLPGEFLNMDAIIEGTLHALVLRPLRDHIYSLLQHELTANGSMQQLRFAINRLVNQLPNEFGRSIPLTGASSSSDQTSIGSASSAGTSSKAQRLPSERYLAKIKHCFAKLSRSFSPLKKLEHLLAAVSILQASLTATGRSVPGSESADALQSRAESSDNRGSSNRAEPINADRLIRPLAYALVHSQCFDAELECEYMWSLLQPTLLGAEGGYYLSTLSACVHALKQFGNPLSSDHGTIDHYAVRVGCSNSLMSANVNTSNSTGGSDLFTRMSCIRVWLPDELSGRLQKHVLPLRMNSTCRDAVRLLAHRFKVHASDDFALMRLRPDGSEQLLLDSDFPLQIQCEATHDHPDTSSQVVFVFKRTDAQFIWPHFNQL